jgi:Uma2 family endonuclease
VARIAERTGMTGEAYLAWERLQPGRHELWRGEVFAMAGGSPRHNALCVGIGAALHAALRGGPCRAMSADQRLGLEGGERYVYPDITVVCGPLQLQPETTDVVTNPSVLVEVLSPSTEQYDRGLNWDAYQRITSLADYLLVSQEAVRIEHFSRQNDGSWLYRALDAGQRITLSNGASFAVEAVFEGVFDLAAG